MWFALLVAVLTSPSMAQTPKPTFDSALSAGPTALFALPGLAVRYDRVAHAKWSVPIEVHGETLGVAGRVGARSGVDHLPSGDGLRGPYVGLRLGTWLLLEQAGPTVAVQAGPTVGYRSVTAKGLVLQSGLGVLPRHSLTGDQAWSRWFVPALELRVGKAMGGAR